MGRGEGKPPYLKTLSLLDDYGATEHHNVEIQC